jgi:hypothetical protein
VSATLGSTNVRSGTTVGRFQLQERSRSRLSNGRKGVEFFL